MVMISDDALDAALDYIGDAATRVDLCTAEPANYAGIAAVSCAYATLAGDGSDFTKANGDTSGRKLTFLGKTGGSGTANSTGIFLAFSDGTNLLAVTACTSQAVTDGADVDFNSYDVTELRDPASE